LSPQDVANLQVEDRGLPMHVAALAVLDGAPLRGPEGRVPARRRAGRDRTAAAPHALLGSLFDMAPDAPPAPAPPWVPATVPSFAELLSDNLRRRGATLARLGAVLANPAR
jgi:hypothetical protein